MNYYVHFLSMTSAIKFVSSIHTAPEINHPLRSHQNRINLIACPGPGCGTPHIIRTYIMDISVINQYYAMLCYTLDEGPNHQSFSSSLAPPKNTSTLIRSPNAENGLTLVIHTSANTITIGKCPLNSNFEVA